MRRTISVLALASGLAVLGLVTASPAQAVEYPPSAGVIVDTPAPAPGGTVRFTATGFGAYERVHIVVQAAPTSVSGRAAGPAPLAGPIFDEYVNANAAGTVSVNVPVGSAKGEVLITATGTVPPIVTRWSTVTVTAPVAAAPAAPSNEQATSGLPPTGTNGRVLLWQVLLASVAIGVGGALLFVTTRRRKPRETE